MKMLRECLLIQRKCQLPNYYIIMITVDNFSPNLQLVECKNDER